MGKERTEDPSMRKVAKLFQASGLTLQELGDKMGYQPASRPAGCGAFLKSGDPQISMLRRFAKAVGVKVESLL